MAMDRQRIPHGEFRIGPAEARRRLDEVVAARLGEISRMRLRQAIRDGEVVLNGATVHGGHRVAEGDRVGYAFRDLGPTAMTPEPIPLSILYEDVHLLAVDKPAGMAAHPTPHHRTGTLANALTDHLNRGRGPEDPWVRPGLPHRLDRATSGVMVVAKSQAALRRLTISFQERQVEKRYLALVRGTVAEEEGRIDAPIGSDPDRRPRWGVMPEGGRPARSRFRVLRRGADLTLLELEPITGRTNQLRIHCAWLGHPILGETEFARDRINERSPERLFLHAHRLRLPHPAEGTLLCLEAALPAAFGPWLEAMGTGHEWKLNH
jgi:23S rRNA pseudouridine1911/1915/1917 synthase